MQQGITDENPDKAKRGCIEERTSETTHEADDKAGKPKAQGEEGMEEDAQKRRSVTSENVDGTTRRIQ